MSCVSRDMSLKNAGLMDSGLSIDSFAAQSRWEESQVNELE
jgi:hypothetical protein